MRSDHAIPIDLHGRTVVLHNTDGDGAYLENPNNNVETVVIDDEMRSGSSSDEMGIMFMARALCEHKVGPRLSPIAPAPVFQRRFCTQISGVSGGLLRLDNEDRGDSVEKLRDEPLSSNSPAIMCC